MGRVSRRFSADAGQVQCPRPRASRAKGNRRQHTRRHRRRARSGRNFVAHQTVCLAPVRSETAVLEPGHFLRLEPLASKLPLEPTLTVFFEGGPPSGRSPPDGSGLSSLVNFFIARCSRCSDTPSWWAIWVSLNPWVDASPIVCETVVQASRGSVARLMNTSTDLRIFMHSSAASRYEVE